MFIVFELFSPLLILLVRFFIYVFLIAFFADYGPLDLGLTYTFCKDLREKLNSLAKFTDRSNIIDGNGRKSAPAVYYYCSKHPHRRANSAVLLLAYLVGSKCIAVLICMLLRLSHANILCKFPCCM